MAIEFNTEFYLQSKFNELQETNQLDEFGLTDVASLAQYFEDNGVDAREHYLNAGMAEGINPSADFDTIAYLEAKLAELQNADKYGDTYANYSILDVVAAFQTAGLTALEHFNEFGEAEGLEATPVGGGSSELTEALNALLDARAGKETYLEEARDNETLREEQGIDDDSTTSTVETAIGTEYTTSAGALNVGVTNFATRVPAVQDAAIAEAVAGAEKAVSDAQGEVAKVAGLGNAASTLVSAQEAYKASLKTAQEDFSSVVGEVARGNDLTDQTLALDTIADVDALVAKLPAAGAVDVTLATYNSNPAVTLSSQGVVKAVVDSQTVPNIDALVADLQAAFNAGVNKDNSLNAFTVAANSVLNLESELVFVDNADTAIANGSLVIADGTQYIFDGTQYFAIDGTPSLDTSGNVQLKAIAAAETTAPANPQSQTIANVDVPESVVITATDGELTPAFNTAAPLSADVVTQQTTLNDLNEAVERFQNARDLTDGLETQDDTIEAASDALEELGFDVVDLDGPSFAATSADDIFLLVEGQDSTITNFGLQGEDRIYFGEGYELTELAANESINNRVGDADQLEIFWKEVAGNMELYVEAEAFAGNATNSADITKITLTGVSADDIDFAGGFLTVGEVA